MLIDKICAELNGVHAALIAGHTATALDRLDALIERTRKSKTWTWLRGNQPQSYDQLLNKLQDASEGLGASGRTQLGQMIRVFTWCRDHDITLEALGVPGHLHKYREASAKLSSILTSSDEEWEIKRELLSAIGILKSHPNRAATRAWARTSRERGSRQEGS